MSWGLMLVLYSPASEEQRRAALIPDQPDLGSSSLTYLAHLVLFIVRYIVFLFCQLYWFLCQGRRVFGIWGGRIWLKYDFLARIFPGVPLKAGIICRPRLESLWWINKSPLLRNICKNYGFRKVFLYEFASLWKLTFIQSVCLIIL